METLSIIANESFERKEHLLKFHEIYITFVIESINKGTDWVNKEFFQCSDKYEKREPFDYYVVDYRFVDIFQFLVKIPIINMESDVFSIPFLQKINQYIDLSIYIVYHFCEGYVDVFKDFSNFDDAHQYYQKMLEKQKKKVEEWNKQLKVSDEGKLLRRDTGPTIEDFNRQLSSSVEPFDESDLEMFLAMNPDLNICISPKIIKQKKDYYPFSSTVYEEVCDNEIKGIKCNYKGHLYTVQYPDQGCKWVLTKFNINSSHIKTEDVDGYY